MKNFGIATISMIILLGVGGCYEQKTENMEWLNRGEPLKLDQGEFRDAEYGVALQSLPDTLTGFQNEFEDGRMIRLFDGQKRTIRIYYKPWSAVASPARGANITIAGLPAYRELTISEQWDAGMQQIVDYTIESPSNDLILGAWMEPEYGPWFERSFDLLPRAKPVTKQEKYGQEFRDAYEEVRKN